MYTFTIDTFFQTEKGLVTLQLVMEYLQIIGCSAGEAWPLGVSYTPLNH